MRTTHPPRLGCAARSAPTTQTTSWPSGAHLTSALPAQQLHRDERAIVGTIEVVETWTVQLALGVIASWGGHLPPSGRLHPRRTPSALGSGADTGRLDGSVQVVRAGP